MPRKIPQKLFIKLSVVTLVFLLIEFIIIYNKTTIHTLTIVLSIALLWIIIISNYYNNDTFLFNPLLVFSAMYSTTTFTILYYIKSEFRTNLYFSYSFTDTKFVALLELTAFMFVIGYIMFVLGYRTINTKHMSKTENSLYESNKSIDYWKYKLFNKILIITFFIIAITNFAYVVINTNGGNIVNYMKYISVREYVYNKRISTLGYNFGYVALYLYTLLLCHENRKLSLSYYLMFISMIFIRVSTGRIFQTIVFIMTIAGIKYKFNYDLNFNCGKNNKKFIIYVLCVFVFAIAFYILRSTSSIAYNRNSGDVHAIIREILDNISFYAYDKGNTVNVILVVRMISSWGEEIGYMYGRTLFSSLVTFIPKLSELFPMTSLLIKTKWYSNVSGGMLPPTCIGELFVNFGYIGIVIGMFIIGIFSKKLYIWFKNSQNNDYKTLIYFVILLEFIFILPKADFSNFPTANIIILSFCFGIKKLVDKASLMRNNSK